MGHSRGGRDATGMLQEVKNSRRELLNVCQVWNTFWYVRISAYTTLAIHLQMLETSGLCQIWGMTKKGSAGGLVFMSWSQDTT